MKMQSKECYFYGMGTILIMGLGLASRKFGAYLPEGLRLYAGDTLWAMMVYFGIHFLAPSIKMKYAVVLALVFSYGIEISQLYQADWINSIRATRLGALVLGQGFLWSDLRCYTVGIIFGSGIEFVGKKLMGL